MSEQFLTTGDVARRFGVSTEIVRVWERNGKIKAIRTSSGQRIFRSDDVEQLAVEREEVKAARAAKI